MLFVWAQRMLIDRDWDKAKLLPQLLLPKQFKCGVDSMWLKRLMMGPTHNKEQSHQMPIVAEPTSHEMVYEEIKARLSKQQSQIDALNSKANSLIGFGGAILAILLGTQTSWLAGNDMSKALTVLGGSMLIFSVVFAYRGYQLQSYRADPNPRALAEKYRDKPIGETREALMSNLVDRFESNECAIKLKVVQIRWAFRLQLSAVALLGIATLFSILRDARIL